MKKLKYEIDIAASQQHVWETMISPETYQQWVKVSWPNSYYEGKWKQGEYVSFIGPDGSGTLANITEFKPFKSIKAKHTAVLLPGGVQDTTSDIAKGWIGIREDYTFSKKGDKTHLEIDISTNPDWEKMFNDGWPNALQELKKLCEA